MNAMKYLLSLLFLVVLLVQNGLAVFPAKCDAAGENCHCDEQYILKGKLCHVKGEGVGRVG